MLNAEQQIRKEVKQNHKNFVKSNPGSYKQGQSELLSQMVKSSIPNWDSSSKVSGYAKM